MKVLQQPKGKTKFLLEYAAKNNIPVITDNKDSLKVKAQSYGIDVEIIDFYDLDDDNYVIGECVIQSGNALIEWLMDRYYGLTPTYIEMDLKQ